MRRIVATLGLALAAACGDGSTTEAPSASGAYIAFANDFGGYHGWHVYSVDPLLEVAAGIHAAGKRTEYIDRLPPHGALAFPTGTIIVKEIHADVVADSRTFAMVKRGGGFNADGSSGWEWFELQMDTDPVVIIWRGVGPPLGEKYGGDGTGTCNTCHGTGRSNDYVLSKALQLASF